MCEGHRVRARQSDTLFALPALVRPLRALRSFLPEMLNGSANRSDTGSPAFAGPRQNNPLPSFNLPDLTQGSYVCRSARMAGSRKAISSG